MGTDPTSKQHAVLTGEFTQVKAAVQTTQSQSHCPGCRSLSGNGTSSTCRYNQCNHLTAACRYNPCNHLPAVCRYNPCNRLTTCNHLPEACRYNLCNHLTAACRYNQCNHLPAACRHNPCNHLTTALPPPQRSTICNLRRGGILSKLLREPDKLCGPHQSLH
uniref:Uncharacterized protein n=1 Tax=Nothoprocta perdicaria TaxID=30464 RepID=A0A8C6ZK49_NOTPE